ncbi:ATP-dependent helicase HepA [compost metagenome]
MPHQLDMLKKYMRHTRYADLSDPGAGKTFPAQTHAVLMAAMGNKVCFTMPPKLIGQFIQELKDFFIGIEKHLLIDHLDCNAGQKAKKEAEWERSGWPDILVLSYDTYRLYNDKHPLKKIGNNLWRRQTPAGIAPYFNEEGNPAEPGATPCTSDGRPINRKGMAKNPRQMLLKERGYNVLFFDEGHALCGMESILSKSVAEMSHRLGDDVAIYIMTGTPVPTHLHDVYGILRLINPDAYLNKASFMRQHCEIQEFTVNAGKKDVKVRQVVGYFNVDKVYEALWKNSHRVQKRDVIELPEPLISEVPVRLSGPHAKLYKQVINDHFAIVGDNVLAPESQSAVRHMALQLISCPSKFGFEGDNELAKAADQLLASIAPCKERKVIIFAYYRAAIDELSARYKAHNPAVVYGDSADSQEEIRRFKQDDACTLLIINWVSGGAGLNLQVASYILFYEIPTSPKDAKQAIARSDRKGQANIVNVYFLRVMKTLSDRNMKNLLKNEESNNRVIRDKKDLLHELLG